MALTLVVGRLVHLERGNVVLGGQDVFRLYGEAVDRPGLELRQAGRILGHDRLLQRVHDRVLAVEVLRVALEHDPR